MAFVIIRHKVQDFVKWKVAFDGHAEARQNHGSRGGRVYRSVDDRNEVIIVLQWSSMDLARAFAASDNLRQAMTRAGVIGEPEISFVEEVDQPAV